MTYIAKLCRLCCQVTDCGFDIFVESEEKASLVILINKYLPIKVQEDDILPKKICEFCHIGVATTVDLIDRMVEGQQRLRTICNQYLIERNLATSTEEHITITDKDNERTQYQKQNERSNSDDLPHSDADKSEVVRNYSTVENDLSSEKTTSKAVVKEDELDASAFADERLDYHPTTQTLINIQGDTPDVEMNDLAKGMNVKKIYDLHPLCFAMDEKSLQKKRRGRPKGTRSTADKNPKDCSTDNLKNSDSATYSRPKRRISLPPRYQDSLAEKEVDALLVEQDANFITSELETKNFEIKLEKHDLEFSKFNFLCTEEEEKTHILEDTTVVVTANHQDEALSELPAAVNIELNFSESNLNAKEFDGSNNSSIENSLRASVQKVEIIPRVEFRPPPTTPNSVIKFKLLPTNRRKKASRRKKPFVCEYCSKRFIHEGRYLIHLKLHKNVTLLCANCNEEFSQKIDLISHQDSTGHSGIGILENENNENRIFKCSVCPERQFFSSESYEKHMKQTHEGEKPHCCTYCSRRYATEAKLKQHIDSHQAKSSETYSCKECGKIFAHQTSLDYHHDTTHQLERKFVCKICGNSFKHRQLLRRHYVVHSEDRPYECTMCKKSFKTQGNLYNHINIHTSARVFTCELCGKQFTHTTAMTLHMRTHTGEKPFECTYCGKRFSQNGNLQEHRRIHTGEKPYCCSECGKNFTTSSQLKLHEKRHKKELEFWCSYCQKRFSSSKSCLSHEAKHREEKQQPFRCSICGANFLEKNSYLKHLTTHSCTFVCLGDRNTFKCATCNKQFFNSATCIKHMTKHWNNSKAEIKKTTKELQQEPILDPSLSTIPATTDIGYVLLKKDPDDFEYISFGNEIFTTDQNQSAGVETLSIDPTINNMKTSFIYENPEASGSKNGSFPSQLEENNESTYEISIKEPNTLGLSIPEEEASLYVKRVFDTSSIIN